MKKYRKKQVVIEAFRWMVDEVPQWWKDAEGIEIVAQFGTVIIPTLKGKYEAQVGDWIIKGIAGEIYPVKDSIFKKTYKAVV